MYDQRNDHTNLNAMSFLNIVQTMMPHLLGPTVERDCRYVNTYEGESTYEVGFLSPGGVRMALFVVLTDACLQMAVERRYPEMTYSHEDVVHYLRYRVLAVLPYLESCNKKGTDYDRIAETLFGNGEGMRGRRFGIA